MREPQGNRHPLIPAPRQRTAEQYGEADRSTYLGTAMPGWLARREFGGPLPTPLCVSHRRLASRKVLPRAVTPWLLDSGGYSELYLHGRWTVPPARYAANVRRFQQEIGNLDYAAIQDWMCEPHILTRTGEDVYRHQARTVASYLTLMSYDDELPWMPVLQGWHLADYLRHVEMYAAVGIDLTAEPRVGLGSICRRQGTREAVRIVEILSTQVGLRLHAFGFKSTGLRTCWHQLYSSDSMAWSYGARLGEPLPGCPHKKCTSCPDYALRWRTRLLNSLPQWHNGTLTPPPAPSPPTSNPAARTPHR
ncbi:hypothetical protein ACL02R_11645 [Streptomyces sp. MS19]|uniref:deazapurine DNA modification protein DpdA family protein n=1 Tax=Streptomyces sp. MS19 TaxID=3385972 RepID=UPI00399FD5D2